MNKETQEWEKEINRIFRGQYPDLFDINKRGQSVWLEKAYTDSLIDLIISVIKIDRKKAQEEVEKLKEALIWCGGSSDFQVGGIARGGWEKIVVPLLFKKD